MSFQSMAAELTGVIPGLSPFLADNFINRAWIDIQNARPWTFLQEDCGIFCPVQVITGSVSITQFSETVTCDAAASAALLAISLPSPLDLTALQIRFGGSGNAAQVGQVYSIIAYDASTPTAVILTLDRVVQQATNATSGYQCYRAYIRPVVDDFLTWTSVVDMTNGWYLRLNYTSENFDRRDPQRQAQGLSYYLGGYKGNSELFPRPQYELWPHPTSGQTFYARFKRKGTEMVNPADELPQMIDEQLVLSRARSAYAYPWAVGNQGRLPELKGVNFLALALNEQRTYNELLLAAKRIDDSQELQTVWNRGHGLVHAGQGVFKGMVNYPIDANFIQSHLVNL